MTDTQLKIMERSDKTLSFGCRIRTKERGNYNYHVVTSSEKQENGEYKVYCDRYELYDLVPEYNTIGHPFGFDRLLYFNATLLGLDNENKQIQAIVGYLEKNNFAPLLTPCIDRPEEGQNLVLSFLQSLPGNN